MNAYSERRPRATIVPKFASVFAVGALAVGLALSAAPAKAATVTDLVSFSITGTYATCGCDPVHGYQGAATATGSFNITFDPTALYLAQPLGGTISGLTYTLTDPFFNPLPLSFNAVQYFGYNGGALTLSSDPTLSKNLAGTVNITIGINGWILGTQSGVWYSQDEYGNTLTGSGTATITEQSAAPGDTPLPAALPLFASGLGALGVLGWRRKRKSAARAA